MISIVQLSELFERELNAILNNPEIQFKIWSEVGQYQPYHRDGNTVTHYINGNLRTNTSANDANNLAMGVNGLSLVFSVPVKRPRANVNQTAEDLQEINDGQYPYVQYITSAINDYFQEAKSAVLPDDKGKNFTVSWQAGTSLSGAVDLVPVLGKCIEISVYIEMYFIEGGTSSKDVKIYFDGSLVPYKAIRFGRSPVTERDVYADKLVSKGVITSTALAIDIDFPSNADITTQAVIDYLLGGEPNVAHFVDIEWGDTRKESYLMTVNTVQTSAQGVAIAGVSVSLMEVVDNLFDVSEGYQIRKFIFKSSTPPIITVPTIPATQTNLYFALSMECTVYIAGRAFKVTAGTNYYVNLTSADLVYDEELDAYCVTLITGKQVSVIRASAPYIGVYGVTAISGEWKWNDNLTYTENMSLPVDYKSKGTAYHSISLRRDTPYGVMGMRYLTSTTNVGTAADNVCETSRTNVTTWVDEGYKTIDFGTAEQEIGSFYDYLKQNAKKVI